LLYSVLTMLSGLGHPFLVLRLGIMDSAQPGPPHTPRLPAKQLIEISTTP